MNQWPMDLCVLHCLYWLLQSTALTTELSRDACIARVKRSWFINHKGPQHNTTQHNTTQHNTTHPIQFMLCHFPELAERYAIRLGYTRSCLSPTLWWRLVKTSYWVTNGDDNRWMIMTTPPEAYIHLQTAMTTSPNFISKYNLKMRPPCNRIVPSDMSIIKGLSNSLLL
jgi:hypothetical protein